jgi:hypothetical protein
MNDTVSEDVKYLLECVSHMIALVARIRAYLAATKPPLAEEVTPVEWRYLYYGKGNWKHVYNADAAAALYAESAALPKRKQHVIEPLYTHPDASPPMPGRGEGADLIQRIDDALERERRNLPLKASTVTITTLELCRRVLAASRPKEDTQQ